MQRMGDDLPHEGGKGGREEGEKRGGGGRKEEGNSNFP